MYSHLTTRTQKYANVYTIDGYRFEKRDNRYVPCATTILPDSMPRTWKKLADISKWLRLYNEARCRARMYGKEVA